MTNQTNDDKRRQTAELVASAANGVILLMRGLIEELNLETAVVVGNDEGNELARRMGAVQTAAHDLFEFAATIKSKEKR